MGSDSVSFLLSRALLANSVLFCTQAVSKNDQNCDILVAFFESDRVTGLCNEICRTALIAYANYSIIALMFVININ